MFTYNFNKKIRSFSFLSLLFSIEFFLFFQGNQTFAQKPNISVSAVSEKSNPTRTYFSKKRLYTGTTHRSGVDYLKGTTPPDKLTAEMYGAFIPTSDIHSTGTQNTITITGAISITITSTNTTCGYSNGAFIVHASNGTPPYMYAESGYPFQSAAVFIDKAPGTYTVTVKDAAGQTATASVTLTNTYPAPVVGLYTYVNPSPCSGQNGSVTLQASGGTPPYMYSADNVHFQSSPTLTNLSAAVPFFSFFVRDANGCTYPYFAPFYGEDCSIQLQIACSNACTNDGFIEASSPIGGTAPYQYSLDGINYQSSGNFSNLAAGLYKVYTKDATGLLAIYMVQMFQSCNLNATATATDATCGKNDGSIAVSITNGIAPFLYSVDGINFQTSNIFNGLAPGNYTIFVNDANSVQGSVTGITINNNCPPIIVNATAASCGKNNGSISVTATGTPPINIQ